MPKVKTNTNDLVNSSQAVKEIDENTVSINDGMTVKNDGDVEIGKDLEVDGNVKINGNITSMSGINKINTSNLTYNNGAFSFSRTASSNDKIRINSSGFQGNFESGFLIDIGVIFLSSASTAFRNAKSYFIKFKSLSFVEPYYNLGIIILKDTITCTANTTIASFSSSFNFDLGNEIYYAQDLNSGAILKFNASEKTFTINKDLTSQDVCFTFIVGSVTNAF